MVFAPPGHVLERELFAESSGPLPPTRRWGSPRRRTRKSSSVANIDVLQREAHHLGRELLQERPKVKALSEELENPLNVARVPPGVAQARGE